jgi:hypothetical protein
MPEIVGAGFLQRVLGAFRVIAVRSSPWLVAVVLGVGIVVAVKHYVTRLHPGYGQYLVSRLVSLVSVESDDTGARQSFREIEVKAHAPDLSHSHGYAAVDRSAANAAMDAFIWRQGCVPYSVSSSSRDLTAGVVGNRAYYGAKDLALRPHYDGITSCHILKFVDVDYYPDMDLYARFEVPMLIYTFVPRTVGGVVPNGLVTIVDDVVHVMVDGGAAYSHRLWNYDSDCIIVHFWNKSVVFLKEALTTTDIQRRIIGLFPVKVVYTCVARLFPGFQLRRREFRVGEVNVMRFNDRESGLMISVGFPGEFDAITVPERLLQTILTRVGASEKAYIADVERVVNNEKPKIIDSAGLAARIFRLLPHLKQIPQLNITTDCGRLPDTPRQVNYQTLKPLVFEDGVATLRIIGPQLCTGNVAPVRSLNNDTDCVEARVTNVANKVKRWPGRFDRYFAEFNRFLVPDDMMHRGVPCDTEEVCLNQSRPSQRRGFERIKNFMGMSKFIVSAFQKGESYPGFKHPRNISTVNADHRTRYAAFLYRLSAEVLKPLPFWAFGKTPKQVADRVHELCAGAETVTPTDYSAWDGTHSADLAKQERALCLRYFNPRYHREIADLVMCQYNATAFTKHGVRYNTGDSRLSGSGDTSDFNGYDNAGIQYCTYRESGETPAVAFAKIGLVGGDDGLAPDIDTELFKSTAALLGHKLKAETVRCGDPVPMLGRYYLSAWEDSTSVADVQRQARKFHVSTSPVMITDVECLVRKAQGYFVTDSCTPLISNWCQAILRIHPNVEVRSELLQHDVSWFARQGHMGKDQWPQRAMGDWDSAWEFAASQLSTTVARLREVCAEIDAAVRLEDLPTLCFDLPFPIDVPVSVNGSIIEPTGDEPVIGAAGFIGPLPRAGDPESAPVHANVGAPTNSSVGPDECCARGHDGMHIKRSPSFSSQSSTGSSRASARGRPSGSQRAAAVRAMPDRRGTCRHQSADGTRDRLFVRSQPTRRVARQ